LVCPDRLEKQVAPFTQRAEDVLQQLDAGIKTGEQLERETHEKVRGAAISAYAALDDAVTHLLTIQRGTARLQRVDPAVINKLELAAERFSSLHKSGDTNAWKLGKDASALMSFGDNTKKFSSTLQEERQRLKRQLKEHAAGRDRHKEELKVHQRDEDTIKARKRKAVRSSEDGWNKVAFFFKPSEKDKLTSIISDADKDLEKNGKSQRAVNNKIRVLYLLDTLIGWAMRALDVVIATVSRIAQDFQAKSRHILTAQQSSDRLLAGLLGMSNAIRDTNFRTSRDNSLRVTLDVLSRYHELRADHPSLDIPGIEERRIHRAICNGLGEAGVRKLMEPPAPVDTDDAINDM
jgi:hypothetical protein